MLQFLKLRLTYLKYLTRHVLLLAFIAASLFFLNNPQIYDGQFLGDDLQVWNGHNAGTFASNFQESIRNTSLDKWRPLNTLLMIPLLKVFEDSHRNFYYFSTSLLAITLSALWMTARKIKRHVSAVSTSAVLLGVLAVGLSPFTFFARGGVFGLLEIGPVILCLVSFYIFQLAKLSSSRRFLLYSSIFALAAGLIHERFLAFSIALSIFIAWRARTIVGWRGLWLMPLFNIFVYVYFAFVVLNANILKGGGEQQLSDTAGIWIVRRTFLAAIQLIGGAGGETIYFDSARPYRFAQEMKFSDNYSLKFPLIILISIVFIACMFIRQWRTNRASLDEESRFSLNSSIEGLFIAVILLLPAATVSERIEARWLFAPLVFLVLALMILPSAMYWPVKVGQFMVLALFIVSNYTNQNSYQEFDWWRIRSVNVIEAVVKGSEQIQEEWNLAIVWPEPNDAHSMLNWSLGEGKVFNELENKPIKIFFGHQSQIFGHDSDLKQNLGLYLIVKVSDIGNFKDDVRKYKFQTIKTRIQKLHLDVDPQRG